MDAYKELVKDTYYLIKEMHMHIAIGDYSDVSPEDMRNYIDLVARMSMFSTSCGVDESEDYTFTACRHLAFDLADLGANSSYYDLNEDDRQPDGIIESIEGMAYGMRRSTHYDVNKGDMSDYYELAEYEWSDDEE